MADAHGRITKDLRRLKGAWQDDGKTRLNLTRLQRGDTLSLKFVDSKGNGPDRESWLTLEVVQDGDGQDLPVFEFNDWGTYGPLADEYREAKLIRKGAVVRIPCSEVPVPAGLIETGKRIMLSFRLPNLQWLVVVPYEQLAEITLS